jgi:hypothetical protein
MRKENPSQSVLFLDSSRRSARTAQFPSRRLTKTLSVLNCLLHIGCCLLLPVVYCLLSIGYCLLYIVYCLLSIVYWLLAIVYCLLSSPRGFQ